MRNLENEFVKRSIDFKKLEKFGFKKNGDRFVFKSEILNGEFRIEVFLSEKEQFSRVIDVENESEYVLVDVDASVGSFVGNVRGEYERIINEILDSCTVKESFKSRQAKEVIGYVSGKYGDKLEFLWEKYDDCAIFRNKQNEKWYAILMTISEGKIKDGSKKIVEIIDLKCDKERTSAIVDNKLFFPGYHMNKKSWITVILDDSVPTEDIFELIDDSYKLSIGNKRS